VASRHEVQPRGTHGHQTFATMTHQYFAEVTWKSDGSPFAKGVYSRAHRWRFDCGVEVDASASPSVVPLPYSREDAIDPEEAFVAAISSCHMLTFLYLASKQGVDVVSYCDRAIGFMEASTRGRLAVTRVTLNPEIAYGGEVPAKDVIDRLHHAAHDECFIANSVKTVIEVR
jgi:organic hydroperoxide reductase OsmC/OhrA